jgi:tetratricopeptide (TPR) repeat protein
MRSKLLLIALLFAMSGSLHAQINIDSLFTSAINDSRQEKYDEAIAKSEQILTLYPDRYDVMVFVANVYAWKGETDIALTYIEKAYELNSANTELYDSWLNILLWSGKYEKIIETRWRN